MTLSHEQVRTLLVSLRFTRDRELTCDEWLEDLSTYLEATPTEKLGETFQLVREHLDLCSDCREEIAMMVMALCLSSE
ncbi:MAG: hypothetical protein K2Y37_02765 [Pirellulales bacterium]|nr:hypothetical protein [Pirellulales bacterium]